MPTKTPKRFLTTGQAAAILRCSQQTVIRACDAGTLKSHRIPPSRFRRIDPDDLKAFCAANRIPMKEAG